MTGNPAILPLILTPYPLKLNLARAVKVVSDTMVVSAYRGAGPSERWWSLVTNRGCGMGGDGGGVTDIRGLFVDGLLTQVRVKPVSCFKYFVLIFFLFYL